MFSIGFFSFILILIVGFMFRKTLNTVKHTVDTVATNASVMITESMDTATAKTVEFCNSNDTTLDETVERLKKRHGCTDENVRTLQQYSDWYQKNRI